jgi:hypothetical protein
VATVQNSTTSHDQPRTVASRRLDHFRAGGHANVGNVTFSSRIFTEDEIVGKSCHFFAIFANRRK